MRAVAGITILAVLLSGCVSSHSFYLLGRQSGLMGSGVVPADGHHGGPITITLGGKAYTGRWIYVETGGAVAIGSATAVSGTQTASATGTVIGLPTGGNGNVLASTNDGN